MLGIFVNMELTVFVL